MKTSKALHKVVMQEHPLTVCGVPFILSPDIMHPLQASVPAKHHTPSRGFASAKHHLKRQFPEKHHVIQLSFQKKPEISTLSDILKR